MLNYIKFFVYTSTLFFCSFGFGQIIFTEDFESGSGGYSTTVPECNSGSDYFDLTDDAGIPATFTGSTGFYFAAQDIDGCTGSSPQSIEWTGINISGCSSLSFSIDFAEDDASDGNEDWDSPDYVHIYYSIDGGAEQDLIWIHNDGSTFNSAPYIDTDFDGVGDGAEITDEFTTFTQAIAGTGSTIDIRIEISLNVGDEDIAFDNLELSGTCGPPPSNTITTGTVSPLTYNVDCTTGEAGTVGFTSTEVYNGGNVFTAELSDATGSFAAPTSIGTLAASGTDPSGTINITIPAGTATGTGYRIRVVSSDPNVTGSDNGTDITITLSGGPCVLEPPHMTSLIINSCNSSCSEGDNEVVFGNTGDYSVLVNSSNFQLNYDEYTPTTTTYTDILVTNPGTTSDLNTEASCPGLFVEGTGNTIPPNSSFMLVNETFCPGDGLEFTNFCGSGPIYVIYTNDGSWNTAGGNFVNSSSCSGGVRYLTTIITATDGSTHTIDYEFDCTLNSGSDGDYAKWNYLGGAAIEQGNNGCTLDPVVLPITLSEFSGHYNGHSTDLAWTTLSEQNNDYFALYHSANGKHFEQIGTVPGSGNTTTLLNYSFEHRTPHPGINYYKLKSVDYDGTVYNKGIIAVLVEMNHVFYNQITQSIQMNYSSDYAVYGSDGRLITRVANQNAIPFSGHGVFHVIDERSGKAFKLGVW